MPSFNEIVVAWNIGSPDVYVGPRPVPRRYEMTTGCVFADVESERNPDRLAVMAFASFVILVTRDRVPVAAAHEAFLGITEYVLSLPLDVPGVGELARLLDVDYLD